MGYDSESAAFLIERVDRALNGPRYNPELAEMFGYALLAMRATVVAVTGKSMVKVRSRQRHPANTKTQG